MNRSGQSSRARSKKQGALHRPLKEIDLCAGVHGVSGDVDRFLRLPSERPRHRGRGATLEDGAVDGSVGRDVALSVGGSVHFAASLTMGG